MLIFTEDECAQQNQRGINMVDLMMWLVIAALLLAAAIQGVGYYQKAAFLYQMQSDLDGAGSRVMGTASRNSQTIDTETIELSATGASWSKDIQWTVEDPTETTVKSYMRASHPDVEEFDVIYLFEACGEYKIGVNVIPKSSTPALEECGIGSSPTIEDGSETGDGDATGSTDDGDIIDDGSGTPTVTWTEQEVTGLWEDMASSADGTKLISAHWDGYVYRSVDSGETWTVVNDNARRWDAVASSADGTKLVALDWGGYLYTSDDSGDTWVERTDAGTGKWENVASSADGMKIFAVQSFGTLHTSIDGGETWTVHDEEFEAIASSTHGTMLLGGVWEGYLYTSTDSGATWTESYGAGAGDWRSFSSSADGRILMGGDYEGYLYTSTDRGLTWTEHTDLGIGYWIGMSSSADGNTLVAGQMDGYLYVSTDSGETWEQAMAGSWEAVNVSDDGTKIVVGDYDGSIYIGSLN